MELLEEVLEVIGDGYSGDRLRSSVTKSFKIPTPPHDQVDSYEIQVNARLIVSGDANLEIRKLRLILDLEGVGVYEIDHRTASGAGKVIATAGGSEVIAHRDNVAALAGKTHKLKVEMSGRNVTYATLHYSIVVRRFSKARKPNVFVKTGGGLPVDDIEFDTYGQQQVLVVGASIFRDAVNPGESKMATLEVHVNGRRQGRLQIHIGARHYGFHMTAVPMMKHLRLPSTLGRQPHTIRLVPGRRTRFDPNDRFSIMVMDF